MKSFLLLGILLVAKTANTRSYNKEVPSINEIRSLYEKSLKSEDDCQKLIDMLEPYKKDPLCLGYIGCATMLMAKHTFSPFSKLSYFKKGKIMLEDAIKADDKNFELRFLRFTAQTNMPSFLGYHDSIEKDKKFILNSFSQIKDVSLEDYVMPALQKSKDLTQSEKEKLK
ncbi:MAG: hypothetical protein ABI184_03995 [Ginsengibacter sp.]